MSSDTDLDLLRRFEPVIRYTRAEEFFPVDLSFLLRDSRRNDTRIRVLMPLRLTPRHLSGSLGDDYG